MTLPPRRRGDLVLTPMGLRVAGRLYPCSIGRNGIAGDKHEGDLATPVGVHLVTGMFYRPDRVARRSLPRWAKPVGPRDLWCDESGHADYNRHVRAPFSGRHERLRRADPLYDLVLTLDWNWPDAVPERGSAIFIHIRRRPGYPTAGCIALARQDLFRIARRIAPGARVVVHARGRDTARRPVPASRRGDPA